MIIYITNKDKEEAKKVSSHLIEKKLAACTNIFPIESMFLWKGKTENESEYVCLVKAKKENWEKIKEEVKKVHSYEIPCITRIDVSANEEFDRWVCDNS